jgi:hypothetical protein
LGANKTVRNVVIGSLAVMGTVESVFWYKTAVRKWGEGEKGGEEEEGK